MSKKYYIIGGVVLFLIITLGILMIFSNNKKPPVKTGNIELTWWKTFETTENVQELIQDYTNAHPGVTINYVKKDVTTFQQDLLNAYASGHPPDIVSIHNDWLPEQIDKLAPMPNGNIRGYNETFVDVAANDFIKDNQIYAVPMNVDLLVLYWNQDLLNSAGIFSPPKTWEELAGMIPQLTVQDKPGNFARSGIALGTAENVNRAVDILSLLMLQNGAHLYNTNLSSAIFDQTIDGKDNPALVALKFYTQFADPSKKIYTWNAKSDNSVDAFTQGKVAMMLSYYYMRPQVIDKAPNLNWSIALVPQIASDSIKANFANYWGEAVTKASKNSDTAWDFLNFITSKDELTKYYAKHKLVSSRRDILTTQVSDSEIGAYAEAALSSRSVYKKDANGFEGVFVRLIDDVAIRGLSPQEALSNAVQQINSQLQRIN